MMDSEIFNKDGSLKKKSPKRYECINCSNLTSKPKTLKLTGISFWVCDKCGGRIKERETYVLWNKRKTGQWDVEKAILKCLISGTLMTKEEIRRGLNCSENSLFDKAFGDLCYWGKVEIHKDYEPIKYSCNIESEMN